MKGNIEKLTKIQHMVATRKLGIEEKVRAAEFDFVSDVVDAEILARDAGVRGKGYAVTGHMTPFAATEAFARDLREAIAAFASNIGTRLPGTQKYNPLFASPALLKGTWVCRQVVDKLGIPYWFYAQHAVRYWAEQGNKRIPRPTQLCTPDVIAHVIGLWADPYFRYHYPVLGAEIDVRFRADHFIGSVEQLAFLEMIQQRVADAGTLGYSQAASLAEFLGVYISDDEAERRFGSELVADAKQHSAKEAALVAELN